MNLSVTAFTSVCQTPRQMYGKNNYVEICFSGGV